MSAPLTLAEVREIPERELLCWDDVSDLVATIEWFAEKALPDVVCNDFAPGCGFDDEPGCQVCRWLRGENISKLYVAKKELFPFPKENFDVI